MITSTGLKLVEVFFVFGVLRNPRLNKCIIMVTKKSLEMRWITEDEGKSPKTNEGGGRAAGLAY